MLNDWTRTLSDELDAIHLVDFARRQTMYRVFLLPDALQIDLSMTPASQFRPAGPRFRLLFGETAVEPEPSTPPGVGSIVIPTPAVAGDLFGWGVIYALHARACIERRRVWAAEHYVGAIRDHALSLACLREGVTPYQARGYDDLSAAALAPFTDAHVDAVAPGALRAALAASVVALMSEGVFDFLAATRRNRRGPLARLVHGVWRLYFYCSLWFIVAWFWRRRYVGKPSGAIAGLVWGLVVLSILGAIVGPPPQNQAASIVQPNANKVVAATTLRSAVWHSTASRAQHLYSAAGYRRLGSWGVRLVRYAFARDRNAALPGIPANETEWLVTYWTVRNLSHTPIDVTSFDFVATSKGIDRPGAGFTNPDVVQSA